MKILEETLALCETCYRHAPATRFIRDNSVWLAKVCSEHGYSEALVEPDAEFYINYDYPRIKLQTLLLDVTNRCNLACPSCYQVPDNKSSDKPVDYFISLIKTYNSYPNIALCGAEPTVRSDLPDLVEQIIDLDKNVIILTNGVNLSNFDFAQKFQKFDRLRWTIGLNHPDYQGRTIREKQLIAINNCQQLGLKIKNISYTLKDLSELEYCLNEIQEFGPTLCDQYRIRCSADIGRHVGGRKLYMSTLLKAAKKICDNNNWTYKYNEGYGIRAHYPLLVNDIPVKIIQWPDVSTLDLREIQTEAMAAILEDQPPSPLIHQVILRDRAINKGKPLYDTIPEEYIENYGLKRN